MALTQISQAGAKDEAINEAKIQISNAGTNGQFLQKQSGNTGGLTWATSTDSTKLPLTGGVMTGSLRLNDNLELQLGTGSDLKIYHSSGEDQIRGTGTKMEIRSPNLQLQNSGAEKYLVCTSDGSVELYYDGSKKLQTYANGTEIVGNLWMRTASSGQYLNDNVKIHVGNSNDLQIYHDGSHSRIDEVGTGDLKLQSNNAVRIQKGASEDIAGFVADGAVELYYDNTKKFETQGGGIKISGGDSGGSTIIGDVFFDNGNQAGKDIDWDQSTAKWTFKDNVYAQWGNSGDLQIYHTGSHAYMTNTTGNWYLQPKSGETAIEIIPDGKVSLRYDGANKLETKDKGIAIQSGQRECNITLQNDARTWKVVNYDYGNNGTDHLGFHDGTTDRVIIQNTGGISFNGDTATANALDDYEEGTFTPAINNSYSSITYSAQNGTYVKIGRMVHCTIAIAMTAATAQGPQVRITGLPFTTHANNYSSGGITYCDLFSEFVDTDPYISGNTTEVRFYKKGSGSAVGSSGNITSEKWLGVGITYQV